MNRREQKIFEDFEKHCEIITSYTKSLVPQGETLAQQDTRKAQALRDYRFFWEYYFSHFCDDGKTRSAKWQIEGANALARNPILTLFLIVHRGGAKSVHADIGYPLWLMMRGDMNFMVLMGYNETKAMKLLSDIQAELQYNQLLTHDFGPQFSYGNWADLRFRTISGVAYEGISLLQDPSGLRNGAHRIDYAVVDDVDNRKKSRNQVLVKEAVDNVMGALREGMAKDRQRLVIANNYKIRNGILDHLLREAKQHSTTKVIWVNAVDKKGEPTWPERYSRQYWEEKRANTGSRTWEREYMNNPIEDGNIFQNTWIRYGKMLPLAKYDVIYVYGDMSYTAQGDYKAWAIVGATGKELHLIDCFVRQCTLAVAIGWLYDVYQSRLGKLVNVRYKYEANATQRVLLEPEFDAAGEARGFYVPIVPDTRNKGNKFDRIEKEADAFEAGLWVWNEDKKGSPDFQVMEEQLLAFEKGSGAHDDGPDALQSASYEIGQLVRRRNAPHVILEPRKGSRKTRW